MQVEQYLPPLTPALPYIQDLQIIATDRVQVFPDSVAGGLRSLTSLSLSGNSFARIPTNLTMITTLQKLDLSQNKSLELHIQDLDTLSGLPYLQVLDIRKTDIFFSQESVEILRTIGERFPALHVVSNHQSREETEKEKAGLAGFLAVIKQVSAVREGLQAEDDEGEEPCCIL